MAEATELAHTLLNPVDGLLRVGKATVLLASHSCMYIYIYGDPRFLTQL